MRILSSRAVEKSSYTLPSEAANSWLPHCGEADARDSGQDWALHDTVLVKRPSVTPLCQLTRHPRVMIPGLIVLPQAHVGVAGEFSRF